MTLGASNTADMSAADLQRPLAIDLFCGALCGLAYVVYPFVWLSKIIGDLWTAQSSPNTETTDHD